MEVDKILVKKMVPIQYVVYPFDTGIGCSLPDLFNNC